MARVVKARKDRGLTQAELGEKVGVNQRTISKLESGEIGDMMLSRLIDLAAVLELPIAELINPQFLEFSVVVSSSGETTFFKDAVMRILELPEDEQLRAASLLDALYQAYLMIHLRGLAKGPGEQ
ncbi:MAG: helix-turn-helix transcriptional regulator [Chloroflexota bacterium]